MRNWLDTLLDRGLEAAAKDTAPGPTAKPPEIKAAHFQRRAPQGKDPGEIDLGYYSITDGVLTMHRESGEPTGTVHRLASGDNPYAVASRFAWLEWRNKQGDGDFSRRLEYGESAWR